MNIRHSYWFGTVADEVKSAADQGDPSAQYHLAVLIEKYNSYLAFNYYKRLSSYKSASSTIIRKVAECYEEGFGTKKNYEMARALYLKALEMGEKGVEDKTKEKYWKKKKLRDMWDA